MNSFEDIRQNALVTELLRLSNERDDIKKKEIVEKIQELINQNQQTAEKIFAWFERYWVLKNVPQTKVEQLNQLKETINTIKNNPSAITLELCENVLQRIKINDEKSILNKDIKYTEYLKACEKFEEHTGQKPYDVQTQFTNTKNTTKVDTLGEKSKRQETQAQANTDGNRDDSIKPPVFFSEQPYQNGSVTICRGISREVLEQITQDAVAQVNAENVQDKITTADKPLIEFKLIERGHMVTAQDTQSYARYQELVNQAIQDRYHVISYTADAKVKEIPVKKYPFFAERENENLRNKNNASVQPQDETHNNHASMSMRHQ